MSGLLVEWKYPRSVGQKCVKIIYNYITTKSSTCTCMYNVHVCFIMWYKRVCNCKQYCFDLARPHEYGTANIHVDTFATTGLHVYTRDYSEQLWFPLMIFISHNH